MTTYLLMGLLVLGIAFSVLWKLEYSPDKNTFMSVDDTTFLRGFWCIVVVLVHVPATYQNRIQDMLGSFAYIGVTFFFITSSYGLKWSIEHKPQYLNCFWRKRLPPILIPALIANALKVLIDIFNGETFRVVTFINIDGWVRVLLLYYFIFWFVYKIAPKMLGGGRENGKKSLYVLLCLDVV